MDRPSKLHTKPFTWGWANAIALAYFAVGFVEIVSEYLLDKQMVMMSKPLLIPLLAVLYLKNSSHRNRFFLAALCCTWIANMFFISTDFRFIIIGTLFFTTYRILVITLVLRLVKLPGVFPLLVGSLPFLFLYLFVMNVAYDELEQGFWLFVVQGVFMIVFGGLSLGIYIFKSNRANTYLLISTMLFTFTQFLFVIRLFYTAITIFQPLAMLLYVVAQFLFYKFLVIEEAKISGA